MNQNTFLGGVALINSAIFSAVGGALDSRFGMHFAMAIVWGIAAIVFMTRAYLEDRK